MTDTAPVEAPAETPEAPVNPYAENQRRSVDVIERDRRIARLLANAPAEGEDRVRLTVEQLAERLEIGRNATDASVVNLKRRGFVEKERTESRTPIWFLTDEGRAYVDQLPAV
jgi:DNA-binding MarR family transcriptional regulator